MNRTIILPLVLALTVAWPAAARAYLPPGFIGISPQGEMTESDYQLMREANVDSVRLPMSWAAIQDEPPGIAEPDWAGFDREVELAAEAGVRVMPFVFSSPAWAAPQPIDLPVRSAWQRWGWSTFLRAAEARYGPRGAFWREHPLLPYLPVRAWEIWNEENIVTFYKRPDPADFAKLIRISGRILHRADPSSKVIVGGLFGRPLQIPPNIGSGAFLSGIYRAGDVKPYFDGVALHPYVAQAQAMAGELANLRRIMRRHHDGGTPIYVTELGWGSSSGPTRWQRGIWGQAKQLSRAFSILSANRIRWRIGGVWWFTWSDEGGTCSFCRSAGLLTASREAKPSWYRFNSWTDGDPYTVRRALIEDGEFEEPGVGEEAPGAEGEAPGTSAPVVE
jgi:polysaccharide biosynthesis protein PslG